VGLPLRGSASGVLNTFILSADERILQLPKAFDGNALVRVDFRTKGGRNFGHGVVASTLTGPNVRSTAERPAGVREFGGLSGSAGAALYDVSMIFPDEYPRQHRARKRRRPSIGDDSVRHYSLRLHRVFSLGCFL
jgi:hypothetical protein